MSFHRYYKKNAKYAYHDQFSIGWCNLGDSRDMFKLAVAFRSEKDQHSRPAAREILNRRIKMIDYNWAFFVKLEEGEVPNYAKMMQVLESLIVENTGFLQKNPQQRKILVNHFQQLRNSRNLNVIREKLEEINETPKPSNDYTDVDGNRIVFKHYANDKISVGIAKRDKAVSFVFACCSDKDVYSKDVARKIITERFKKRDYSGALYFNSPITNMKHVDIYAEIMTEIGKKLNFSNTIIRHVPPSKIGTLQEIFNDWKHFGQ